MTDSQLPNSDAAHTESMSTDPATIEPLWTIEDVAIFTATSVSTLYSLRSARRGPPGARIGRSLRFKPDAVRAWFDLLTAASEGRRS